MGSIGINKIKMKIRYMHLKPKFINLDHFKIWYFDKCSKPFRVIDFFKNKISI